MKLFLGCLVLCLVVQVISKSASSFDPSSSSPFTSPQLSLSADYIPGIDDSNLIATYDIVPHQTKAGLGNAFGQLIIANTAVATNLFTQLGSDLQSIAILLNSTHTAHIIKHNSTVNALANLLVDVSNATATYITNHTIALATHLGRTTTVAPTTLAPTTVAATNGAAT